jgi:NRPS condensation-like uncharacterized protein
VVAQQTDPVRRHNRSYGLHDLLEDVRKAPLAVKRVVPRLLNLVGDRFVDTTMLSNLGRIPDPPTFPTKPGSGPPELWFSPPCDPTCSVCLGVATSGARLALVVRYRYEQFDADAAEEFTDLLITTMGSGHRGAPETR